MSVGKLPTEFTITRRSENVETIFLTEAALVPVEIPVDTLFISKDKASISDFIELLLLYDESFEQTSANFAVLGLGAYDISTRNKFVSFNIKTHLQEFAPQQNLSKRMVEHKFTTLVEMIREIKGARKVVSTAPLSADSNGYHNRLVEHVSTHVKQVDDGHTHLYTRHRYQRNVRKNKNKTAENFPLITKRYGVDGELLESEKQILVSAALKALKEDGDVTVDGFVFKRRF